MPSLVLAAHRHMMAIPLREKLTGDYFRRCIAEPAMYRSLGADLAEYGRYPFAGTRTFGRSA